MKNFLLLITMCVSLSCNAQNKEKEYSTYVIISYNESIDNKDFTVNIDDGTKIDYLKDDNGKKVQFRTPAAALAYFESLGWELCSIGTSPKDGGTFHAYLSYWVFKRKVSKEDYDNVVNNALRKK